MISIVGIMSSFLRGTTIKDSLRNNSSHELEEWIGWWIKRPFLSIHTECRWTEAEVNPSPPTTCDRTNGKETPISSSSAYNPYNLSSLTNSTRRNPPRWRCNNHLWWMRARLSWRNMSFFLSSSIWWSASAARNHQLIMRNRTPMDGVPISPVRLFINLCSWVWGWRTNY